MVKRLTPLPFRKVREVLMNNGFQTVSSKGSHHKYKDKFGRTVVVPKHSKDIPLGTLHDIIKRSMLGRDKFFK
ncbi:MAG: type II toxin-antitoxin system HicA family toxin [Candidatus Dadabacteria bacterium]|nr:type II toxin-antitoxin system HicA family toxin [Candidatus Dadabacteria bacterium]